MKRNVKRSRALSLTQMEELKNLGMDISDASIVENGNYIYTGEDILAKLPKEIDGCKRRFNLVDFIGYWNNDKGIVAIKASSGLDALFQMLKWCKQNNYI